MNRPHTHLVLIPAFNPGRLLAATVGDAHAHWEDVWVVVDASTDGSHEALEEIAGGKPGLRIMVRDHNGGKGAAVLTGAREALACGFSHALVMDADGQHPAERIVEFMEASTRRAPEALGLRPPDVWAGRPRGPAPRPQAERRTRAHGDLRPRRGRPALRVPGVPALPARVRARGGPGVRADTISIRKWPCGSRGRGIRAINLDAPCLYVAPRQGRGLPLPLHPR